VRLALSRSGGDARRLGFNAGPAGSDCPCPLHATVCPGAVTAPVVHILQRVWRVWSLGLAPLVAVFRFGYERFELRARLGPGNLEHAIAAAAEVAASVFARWSHEASAFAQRVRAGEDGGPVHH
jgi:hypothetical protein